MQTQQIIGLFFWLPTLLHFLWAILLLYSKSPQQTSAIAGVVKFVPTSRVPWVAMTLIGSSTCAAVALTPAQNAGALWLLMPQQSLLLMSTASAMEAILRGEFRDGTKRHWAFIAADQMPTILLTLFHLMVFMLITLYR